MHKSHYVSHGNYFLRSKWSNTRIGIYTFESMLHVLVNVTIRHVGGNQTIHFLNHGFIGLAWHTQCIWNRHNMNYWHKLTTFKVFPLVDYSLQPMMGKAANSNGNIWYTNMCHVAPNCCLHITYRYWQKLWFKSYEFHMGHNQSHFWTLYHLYMCSNCDCTLIIPKVTFKLQQEFNQFIAFLCILGFTLWNSIIHKNILDIVCQK